MMVAKETSRIWAAVESAGVPVPEALRRQGESGQRLKPRGVPVPEAPRRQRGGGSAGGAAGSVEAARKEMKR